MERINVLLVDDEQEFVETLAERLRLRDFGSDVALNGEEALHVVRAGETHAMAPDVMVLDLRMPGIDGIEVLKRVREEFPHIQVIVLTGHGSDKDEEEVRRLGAFAYMRKPVVMEELVKTLHQAARACRESAKV